MLHPSIHQSWVTPIPTRLYKWSPTDVSAIKYLEAIFEFPGISKLQGFPRGSQVLRLSTWYPFWISQQEWKANPERYTFCERWTRCLLGHPDDLRFSCGIFMVLLRLSVSDCLIFWFIYYFFYWIVICFNVTDCI